NLAAGTALCNSCGPPTFFALFIAGILIADLFGKIESPKSRNIAGAILCVAGLLLSFLPETGSRLLYVAAPVCMVAGVALFAPVTRLFENRVGDFLGWISFPLYLCGRPLSIHLGPRVGRSCIFWAQAIGATVADRSCDRAVAIVFAILFLPGQRPRGDAVAPL